MTDFITLANTIIRDWWLLIFFFTLGGIWWQLKHWFNHVNANMEYVSKEHEAQTQILSILHEKVINIEDDVEAREFIMQKGLRTVPQIFMDGKLFVEGGWTGLSKMSTEDIMNEIELRNSLRNQTL